MGEWKHASGVIYAYCGYYNTFYPQYASDGNWGNVPWWECRANHEHYIVLDMASSFPWSFVRHWYDGRPCGRWTNADVYVSDDPGAFGDPVATALQFTDGWVWNQAVLNPVKSGRYIKFVIKSTGGTGGYYCCSYELQAYTEPIAQSLNLCIPRSVL